MGIKVATRSLEIKELMFLEARKAGRFNPGLPAPVIAYPVRQISRNMPFGFNNPGFVFQDVKRNSTSPMTSGQSRVPAATLSGCGMDVSCGGRSSTRAKASDAVSIGNDDGPRRHGWAVNSVYRSRRAPPRRGTFGPLYAHLR